MAQFSYFPLYEQLLLENNTTYFEDEWGNAENSLGNPALHQNVIQMDDEQTEVKSGHLSFLLLHNRIRKYSISLFQMTLSVRMLISKTTKDVQHSGGGVIRINGRSKAPNKMKGMYKEQLQRCKKIQPSKICSRKNINSHVNCLHRSNSFSSTCVTDIPKTLLLFLSITKKQEHVQLFISNTTLQI